MQKEDKQKKTKRKNKQSKEDERTVVLLIFLDWGDSRKTNADAKKGIIERHTFCVEVRDGKVRIVHLRKFVKEEKQTSGNT